MGIADLQRVRFLLSNPRILLVCALLLAAVVARLGVRDALTPDTITFVMPWYERIAATGVQALGESIPNAKGEVDGNYSPPYYYLLYAASLLDGWVDGLYLIKLISLCFELAASVFAFRLVKLRAGSEPAAWAAALAILLAPTVIANGAWWGQCDMIWAALLLGTFYYLEVDRKGLALGLFGAAIAFKAQSIFFGPFLLMLFLRGQLSLKQAICAPLTYLAMLIPAVAAGRSPLDVLSTYARQGGYFDQLSMNAPNLYFFVPNEHYATGTALGLALTAVAAVVLAALPLLRRIEFTPERRLLAATMFLALAPFLLPKMHDRYFFGADVFSIALAVLVPRLWFVAVMFQITSLAAYIPIISLSRTGNMVQTYMPMAALLNTVTVGFLVYLYCRMCLQPGRSLTPAIRQFGLAAGATAGAVCGWIVAAHVWAFMRRGCPADAVLGSIFCDRPLPMNLLDTTRLHWVLFALMAVTSYVVLKAASARVRSRPITELD